MKKIIIALISLVAFGSCTEDFIEENRNPFQQTAASCPGVVPTSKSVIASNVKEARAHDLYKNVDMVHNQIQQIMQEPGAQAEKSEKLNAILSDLKEAVDLARKLESATQGAYVPARRTH